MHKTTPQARHNKFLCTQSSTRSSTHSGHKTTITIQANGATHKYSWSTTRKQATA